MKDKQSKIPPSKECYSATEGCSLTQVTGGISNSSLSEITRQEISHTDDPVYMK